MYLNVPELVQWYQTWNQPQNDIDGDPTTTKECAANSYPDDVTSATTAAASRTASSITINEDKEGTLSRTKTRSRFMLAPNRQLSGPQRALVEQISIQIAQAEGLDADSSDSDSDSDSDGEELEKEEKKEAGTWGRN